RFNISALTWRTHLINGCIPWELFALDERLSRHRFMVSPMTTSAPSSTLAQHAPHNAMDDSDEIARFYDRCTDLMRELLGELARAPDVPRPFPDIEDALCWPRRRLASVLG